MESPPAALQRAGLERIREQRARLIERTAGLRAENQDRFREVEARFAAEPRDAAWASRREVDLRASLEGAAGSAPLAVQCKRTLCRAEIALDAQAAAGSALPALGRAFPGEVVAGVIGAGTARTLRVYTARAGYALDGVGLGSGR